MPTVPKPKPKNYSKILDMLNSKAAVNTFSPKTYINLVGEYSKKAFDNNEISKKEYMDIVKPLFGDAGIMATKAIEDYRSKFDNGSPEPESSAPDSEKMRKIVEELMDDGYTFGEAVKEAMKKGYQKGGRIGYALGTDEEEFLKKVKEEDEKMEQDEDYLRKIIDPEDMASKKEGIMKVASKPDYWSMVTRMFIEAGGEKGTGMDINEFAKIYFPKND